MTIKDQRKLMSTVIITMLLTACASKGTQEIGDPSLPSPEEHHHYLTINDAFTRHDTNGDGYLDQHEYDQLQTDPAILSVRKAMAEMVESGPLLFAEIDENDDGYISLHELTVAILPLLPQRSQ